MLLCFSLIGNPVSTNTKSYESKKCAFLCSFFCRTADWEILHILPPAQMLEGSAARISIQDFLRIWKDEQKCISNAPAMRKWCVYMSVVYHFIINLVHFSLNDWIFHLVSLCTAVVPVLHALQEHTDCNPDDDEDELMTHCTSHVSEKHQLSVCW